MNDVTYILQVAIIFAKVKESELSFSLLLQLVCTVAAAYAHFLAQSLKVHSFKMQPGKTPSLEPSYEINI